MQTSTKLDDILKEIEIADNVIKKLECFHLKKIHIDNAIGFTEEVTNSKEEDRDEYQKEMTKNSGEIIMTDNEGCFITDMKESSYSNSQYRVKRMLTHQEEDRVQLLLDSELSELYGKFAPTIEQHRNIDHDMIKSSEFRSYEDSEMSQIATPKDINRAICDLEKTPVPFVIDTERFPTHNSADLVGTMRHAISNENISSHIMSTQPFVTKNDIAQLCISSKHNLDQNGIKLAKKKEIKALLSQMTTLLRNQKSIREREHFSSNENIFDFIKGTSNVLFDNASFYRQFSVCKIIYGVIFEDLLILSFFQKKLQYFS